MMRMSRSDRLSDPDAHVRLKKLYIELCPEGMTQERFGEVSGIGSQGMVWQFLNGHTPLTLEAAVRFAKVLGCTLYDISPTLDAAIRADILPVLSMRKRLRRAAMLSLFAALPLHHFPSEAAGYSYSEQCGVYYVKSLLAFVLFTCEQFCDILFPIRHRGDYARLVRLSTHPVYLWLVLHLHPGRLISVRQ